MMPVAQSSFDTRVSPAILHKATLVLDRLGMSVTDAIDIMLCTIARDKCLPCAMEPARKTPNAETREAFEDIRLRRDLTGAKDARDLFGQLASECCQSNIRMPSSATSKK